MVTACLVTVTVVKLSIYKKQYEFVKITSCIYWFCRRFGNHCCLLQNNFHLALEVTAMNNLP